MSRKSRDQQYRQQLEWRYDQVLSLAADGLTEREIASRMQLGKTTIHKDLTTLKHRAKAHIHQYITDQVPWEYKKTLAGLDSIIKYTSSVMNDENKEDRERMQAANIKIQAYNMKMEMVSGANLIEEGIDLVERYRGLTPQKGNPLKDHAEQPT